MSGTDKVRRKAVTMADIAAEAGVSVTTVSHVINKTATISSATCDRVQQAISRLGYQLPASADLNQGHRLIGVFAPEIANEFYARSLQAISNEAWEHNYAVMLCSLEHRHRAEISHIRSLIQSGVQGLIFFGGASDDERQVLEAAKRVPVVLGDRRMPNAAIDSIYTDNSEIVRRLIGKLVHAGYTKIGYAAEDLIMSNSQDRFRGFRHGMEEQGLSLDDRWIFLRPELRLNKTENAYKLFTELQDQGWVPPQVMVCGSDLTAIGLIAAMKARGRQVPRDVGVVGFDNISLAAYTDPPLTTIAQDMRQLGRLSFQTLLERMDNPNMTTREIVVRAKLVIRESVRL